MSLPQLAARFAALFIATWGLSEPAAPAHADSSPPAAPAFGRTDPNSGLYPDSSLVDFHFLVDGPAGRKGFLRVASNGKFCFSDGLRTRFWGINLSRRSVFVDRQTVD